MSLDFHLETEPKKCVCSMCGQDTMKSEEVFWRNITHNLGEMANKAGIYKVLWRPSENGYVYARDIIEILKLGLSDLLNRPDYFKQFDSPNGWGLYEHFVPFVKEILKACEANPDTFIRASV